jgi:hypothetical protein
MGEQHRRPAGQCKHSAACRLEGFSIAGAVACLLHHSNAVPPVSTQIDAIGIMSGAEDACTLVLDVREFVSDAVSNSDIYDRLRSEVIYYFAARERTTSASRDS